MAEQGDGSHVGRNEGKNFIIVISRGQGQNSHLKKKQFNLISGDIIV